MSKYVKVINTELKRDRNGRQYNLVTLQTLVEYEQVTDPLTHNELSVMTPMLTVRAIGYKVPYLYDAADHNANPDYLWHAQTGMAIQGTIVRAVVEPYELDGAMRDVATVFVAGDTDKATEFQRATLLAFERSNRKLVTDARPTHPVPVPTGNESQAERRLNNPESSLYGLNLNPF